MRVLKESTMKHPQYKHPEIRRFIDERGSYLRELFPNLEQHFQDREEGMVVLRSKRPHYDHLVNTHVQVLDGSLANKAEEGKLQEQLSTLKRFSRVLKELPEDVVESEFQKAIPAKSTVELLSILESILEERK